ncbi:alpha/beta fold hydrolase [Paraburkholderia sp.]|uniref:alpha/beta fold hydrolase n=1 Tax=Paraburkholderia sp. TaxID=1926495 RepID=UPI003D6EEA52
MSTNRILPLLWAFAGLAALYCGSSNAADSGQPTGPHAPVKQIADQHVVIKTPEGTGLLPVYADRPIDAAAPDVRRVLIIVHGILRNADVYFQSGQEAVQAAKQAGRDSMVVAPQFLTSVDAGKFKPSPDTLVWAGSGWRGGEPARSPAPISSFAALDGLLEHFANRSLYPALKTVVVAGHSAGAQVVQHYAVVGHGEAMLADNGVSVQYVVANPSIYLYFDESRPTQGALQPADAASCPDVNRWLYGMTDAPAYVASQHVDELEARYVRRNVVYLLGTADTNPYTHFIDRSCAAMAQGPYRFARGLAYFDYLKRRDASALKQRVVEVPGIGHDNRGMFTSVCGLAVLFGETVPSVCPQIP